MPKELGLTPAISDNICTVLQCSPGDIAGFTIMNKGCTNQSFYFEVKKNKYIYRHPGAAIGGFINRRAEYAAEQKAKRLHINNTTIAIDPDSGWKISHYVADCMEPDCRDPIFQAKALQLIRTLHADGKRGEYDFPLMEQRDKYLAGILAENTDQRAALEARERQMRRLHQELDADGVGKCLCHNDTWSFNYLYRNDSIDLIDWEFAGNNDPAFDVANFGLMADFTIDETLDIYRKYLGRRYTEKEKRHFIGYAAASFDYWCLWARWKEAIGDKDDVVGLVALWEKQANQFAKPAFKLYGIDSE